MHPLAIPCLAMSAINAYLALYHLVLALRRPRAREHLPFALLCSSLAAYDVFCLGLYNATSLEQGVFWQRLQLQIVVVISIATIWFVGRLTGTERTRGIRLFIGWFLVLAPLSLLRGDGLSVSTATPAIKEIVWGQHPLITYYESDVGLIPMTVIVSAWIAYAYLVLVLFRHYRARRSRHVLAILIGNVAYFVGSTNDSLIAARIYSFIYVSEYAFLVLILSMVYVLLCRFVDLQSDVERLNADLERTVEQRTAALQLSLAQQRAMQEQLVETSRRSGMADVAADVLHNLGNALNSVTVSVDVLQRRVQGSRLSGLSRVIGLIAQHRTDLPGFFASDGRGKQVQEYLTASTARLEAERESLADELESLRRHVEHINVVVATQQSHAGAAALAERTAPAAVLDDALRSRRAHHREQVVELERAYEPVPDIDVDRHKLLHVLLNLLDNAWYALAGSDASPKRIRVRLRAIDAQQIALEVEDNGCGIPPENLTKIFQHGFTTWREHHGFGLHSSGCAAGEMGGTLVASSDGPGQGARFTLTLPVCGTGRIADAPPAAGLSAR